MGRMSADTSLLVTESHHRIDPHRSTGRNPTGEKRDREQEHNHGGEGKRIGGAHAVEHCRYQAGQAQRSHDADRDSDQRDSRSLSEHATKYVMRLCTKRHPDPDFARR